MKKSYSLSEKKAKQEYLTNLILLNTFEGMGVLILLTVIFRWMNEVNSIWLVYPAINVLLSVSALATAFFGFLNFNKGNKRMFPHFIFSAFLTVIWAVMFFGMHSPYSIKSFVVACGLSVVYFIAVYVILILVSDNKLKIKGLQ